MSEITMEMQWRKIKKKTCFEKYWKKFAYFDFKNLRNVTSEITIENHQIN